MSDENDNDPAFPIPHFARPDGDIEWGYPGLTKRELFAAMAMQGLLSNYVACCESGFQDQRGDFENFAIARADALLAELAEWKHRETVSNRVAEKAEEENDRLRVEVERLRQYEPLPGGTPLREVLLRREIERLRSEPHCPTCGGERGPT